ncbi:LysR substrate-binding domain-containing protein [Fulvivirga maritima]|uniref:hydrogen peroxide-inducible genes activator n=1 Tax=Fulvivirga maritima TaxID=2904247 RepID=UPI001F1CDE51|nr:hydrogen peroxide-inducible genes activator [Fulvivirga maritima]UII28028.1 LysR substrate-binding domain-containing protein [Fulvivirga maritima]
MTLIQFEYIIAVDNYRHFGKAAESCFVTQPTLSMQIHKMEEQLGVMIFDRSKQPVVPTDVGKRIIAQARLALSESKKIKELVAEEKGEVAGELSIGIIPTLSPYLLPLFISNFIEKYPNVKIKVEELKTNEILKKLKNELLDLGLIVTPLNDPGLITKPVFYEEFYAYVSHRSSLYNEDKLHVEELPANEIWLLNEGHCFRDQVLNLCHTYEDKDTQFKYESGSLEALKKIVDKNGGFTLLPELATLDFDKNSKSKLRSFVDPKPVREVSIIMHRSYLKRKLVEALHTEILNAIPDYINIQKHGEVIKWK